MDGQERRCGGCGGCAGGGCGNCGGCAAAFPALTADELDLLDQLAQAAFLPLVWQQDGQPVFPEDGRRAGALGAAAAGLARKGLVSLDQLPLDNYDYTAFASCRQGSMALTARGQAAADLLEIQGIEGQ
ncbi:MAG: hypothetical protein ACI3XT_04225 [Butyricicoccaceae bacterium]